MKIFFINWESYGKNDIIDVLKEMGHSVTLFQYTLKDQRIDPAFDTAFFSALEKDSYDLVFSSNYYPVVSNACNKCKIKYISWVYDSPLITLYSYTVINPCNAIFIFDKALYEELRNGGIKTVHYMPLGVNVKRLDQLLKTSSSHNPYEHDISFVGSLYTEKKHQLFERFQGISDYTKGYLDALIEAQKKIYGYYFVEQLLNDTVLSDLKKACDFPPNKDGAESTAYVYAYYFIARKITALERFEILDRISKKFTLDLYTSGDTSNLRHVRNKGIIDYYTQMPVVFRRSKINLNITLRSIRSGIPLRAMDIMGAGGFLLTNFQADYMDYFEPDVDFVFYNDIDDLAKKVSYYMTHEEKRIQIAENGYHKVKTEHTLRHRLEDILSIALS